MPIDTVNLLSEGTGRTGAQEEYMKERELRMDTNNDKTVIEMTEVDRERHLKNISNLICLASYMHDQIKENRMEEGFKETQLSLLESYTIEILKELNFESKLQKEREARFSEIRSLNIENRELRKQLGDKATAEDVRETLKNIEDNFREFWQNIGFGFSNDYDFGGYGLKVKVSTSMIDRMLHGSDEYIQKRKTEFKDYGFTLVNDGDSDDNALGFSQENIDALNRLLSEHLSDFKIYTIESQAGRNSVYIRDIDIYIRNFDDLLNLKASQDGEQ